MTVRHLILLLGDQLDEQSCALRDADPARDQVLMIEALEESTHVRSHKQRTALFLSAMRHFAASLRERGWTVHYRSLDEYGDASLADGLQAAIRTLQPQAVIGVARRLKLPCRPAYRTNGARTRIFYAVRANLRSGRAALSSCAWSFFTGRCAGTMAF
jgi:hypothetical protein